jgi:3-hydroxymyristoyl/3-hydroxydecanoyl-(acyl carrier protein) dehydratase
MTWDDTLCFAADTPFFAGHFVGQPIVPGVVWINWVEHCVGQTFPDWVLSEVVQCKFLAPIAPDKPVRLSAQCEADPQRVAFRLYDAADVEVASGKLRFEKRMAHGEQ